VDHSATYVGRKVRIWGWIFPSMAGTVDVQLSLDNGKTWRSLVSVTTPPDGSFETFWITDREGKHLLRSVWPGNALLKSATSEVTKVQVSRVLTRSSAPIKQPTQTSWTFMTYIVADNDLGSNPGGAKLDQQVLNQMMSVGSTANVSIVALYDTAPTPSNPTRILYIRKGANETKRDYGANLDTGIPATLTDFVTWTTQNYPAQHYALILWNHGGGFRNICSDYTSDDYLTMSELRSALTDSEIHLDMIGFDACLMGMTEVAFQMRDLADYMTGSEESGVGSGLPYDTILRDLTTSPSMSGAALAETIVTRCEERYSNVSYCTMAASNLGAITELGSTVNAFAETLENGLATYRNQIQYAYLISEWYSDPAYIDLYDFARRISEDPSISNSTRVAAMGVMTSVQNVVISEWHNIAHPNSHGLSIYGEWRAEQYDLNYDGVEFSTRFVWNGFVRKYVGMFDFRIAVSPSYKTVKVSQTVFFAVNVTLYSSPPRTVSLFLSGLPSNVGSYSFGTASGNPSFQSDLKIVTSASAPTGVFNLTVTGIGEGVKRSQGFTMEVQSQTYSATITAYCLKRRAFMNVAFTWDDQQYTTPYSFNLVSGNHTVVIPSSDPHGHSFSYWGDTSSSSLTRIISFGGTYLANYGASPVSPTLRQLTFTPVPESSPSISGDGQWVAFISGNGSSAELYVMNRNGTSPSRLTYNSVPESSPSISGDGQWVAFISGSGSSAELWIMKRDSTGLRQLSYNSVPESSPSISGDGQWVAFISGSGSSAELWIMKRDRSSLTRLSYNSVPESSPSISGDGQWVAFISGSGSSAELWVVSSDLTMLRQLTYTAAPESSPSMSANGVWIAYISGNGSSADLWICNIEQR
jgi:hypothetical protein